MDARSYFKPLSLWRSVKSWLQLMEPLHRFFFHFTQTQPIWLNMSRFYIASLQPESLKLPCQVAHYVQHHNWPTEHHRGLQTQVSLLLFFFSSILSFLQNSGPMFVWVCFKEVLPPLIYCNPIPFTATSSTLHFELALIWQEFSLTKFWAFVDNQHHISLTVT